MTFNYFWRHSLRRILSLTAPLWSDRLFLELMFYSKMGYWTDFKSPTTFCEKMQWLKLNNRRADFTQMVDKVDAKKYVSSVVGEQYIIPTLGVWDRFSDIDFDKLPDCFILKCAHDSSGGIVCRSKKDFDKSSARKYLESKQNVTYYAQKREYPYRDVPHRILAEQFMVNGSDSELKDYKFYCFNGVALYCQLIADRSTDETIDFFDRSWNHQEFIGLNPNVHHANPIEPKPQGYEEMLSLADKLAKSINHPFVRIDLYNVNGKIFFGEITFFPGSGMGEFKPQEWDRKLGDLISIDLKQ